jgi:TRAP-type mannitol/chloroaromatic compound transport system permease small subunit
MMWRQTARRIDAINDAVGRACAWLTAAMVAVTFAIILFSFVFRVGWIWLQESVTYMHGALFTAAAGYTLLRDEHVRIDIFYAKMGGRGRAWVNLCGALLFLLPVCAAILWFAIPYVLDSWRVLEGSSESHGIPAIFLLKSFILVFVLLVGLQGFSLALKSALVLWGGDEEDKKSPVSSPPEKSQR